jgi:exonuclease VII large subunit
MITVSELNEKIKAILETTFMHIVVEGEVSSVTYHTSGHLYFSVKDSKSTLKCVMWKGSVRKLKFTLEKGEHIVIELVFFNRDDPIQETLLKLLGLLFFSFGLELFGFF